MGYETHMPSQKTPENFLRTEPTEKGAGTRFQKSGRKPPKKVTKQRLRNIGLAYVQRYGGSEKRVGEVLGRRVSRSLRYHDELEREGEAASWIAEVVADLIASGAIHDGREARAKAVADSLSGRPLGVIRMRLRQKGFGNDAVDDAIAALSEAAEAQGDAPDPDLVACCRYARRRGLGPFRSPTARDKPRESQLGSLMRAGFRYQYASAVLDAESAEELMMILDGAALPTLT